MDRWAKRHDACLNCGTDCRDHASRGCCAFCVKLMKLKWLLDSWDPAAPGPLAKAPMGKLLQGYPNPPNPSAHLLGLHKAEVLRQVEHGLGRLRHAEQLRRGIVDQLDLETELNYVWSRIRPKPTHQVPSPFQHAATGLGRRFNAAQMSAIGSVLADLTQHIPWRFFYSQWLDACLVTASQERTEQGLAAIVAARTG